jgi:hypothetical protein
LWPGPNTTSAILISSKAPTKDSNLQRQSTILKPQSAVEGAGYQPKTKRRQKYRSGPADHQTSSISLQQQQQDPNQPQDPNQQQQQQNSQQDPNQPQKQQQQQQAAGQDPNQPKDPNQAQDQQKKQQQEDRQQQVAPDTTAQEILDKEQRQRKERQILQPGSWQKVEKDW